MRTKRNYTTFDEQKAIRKAQRLIARINKRQRPLRSIRIDKFTIVQIRADHPDADLIIERIKNRKLKAEVTEQLEYGYYA